MNVLPRWQPVGLSLRSANSCWDESTRKMDICVYKRSGSENLRRSLKCRRKKQPQKAFLLITSIREKKIRRTDNTKPSVSCDSFSKSDGFLQYSLFFHYLFTPHYVGKRCRLRRPSLFCCTYTFKVRYNATFESNYNYMFWDWFWRRLIYEVRFPSFKLPLWTGIFWK